MSYQSEVLADSPLVYLRCEETSGSVVAESGSISGAATAFGSYVRNVAGGASDLGVGINLPGVNTHYVSKPHNSAFNFSTAVAFTLELWVRLPRLGGSQYVVLISKGNESGTPSYTWMVNPSRQLTMWRSSSIADMAVSTGLVPNDGAWHHLVVTRTSGYVYTFYIDGVAAGGGTNSNNFTSNNYPVSIGRELVAGTPSGNALLGGVDEIAIYNTALSSTRVAAHYAARGTPATPASGYQALILNDVPLYYHRFSEAAGTACDDQGAASQDATTHGAVTRDVATLSGITPGVTLGGTTSDYIDYTHNPYVGVGATADVTIEAWVKPSVFGTYQIIWSAGKSSAIATSAGITFRITDTNKLQFSKMGVADLGTSTGTVPNDGNWHHVAVTRAGSTITFYIDGVAAGTATSSTVIGTSTLSAAIGSEQDGGAGGVRYWPYNGAIDEVAVYGTALNAAQIAAHAAAGVSAVSTFVPKIAIVA